MAKGRAFHGRGAPGRPQGASGGANQSQAPPKANARNAARPRAAARLQKAMSKYLV